MNRIPAGESFDVAGTHANTGSSKDGGRKGRTNGRLKVAIPIVVTVAAAACLCGFFLVNTKANIAKKNERVTPVYVATAISSRVPIKIRSIGNVTPYSVVNITPQVSGQLAAVRFNQGDLVKKGQLLFQIDPRPYQAAVNQAEGNVAKDKALIEAAQANMAKDQAQVGQLEANLRKDIAQLTYATKESGRYSELVEEGAVSHEQSDQMNTNEVQASATIEADKKAIENGKAVVKSDIAQVSTARATLKADEGAADNARIQLGWTQIRAPIDGRTSSLNVYQGNVVTANSTNPIVSIAQVLPIYVTVTVPEQYLNDIRRAQEAGTLQLEAQIEGAKTDLVAGNISFIENTVNTNTGTIMLRASFANANMHLYPGQFVDVVLSMPPAGESVVVPSRAIQTTQQGQSVYVLKSNNTVQLKPVTVGQVFGDSAAITDGLSVGDQVVTDGQLQLMPGGKVRVQDEKADAAGGGGVPGGGGHRGHHKRSQWQQNREDGSHTGN